MLQVKNSGQKLELRDIQNQTQKLEKYLMEERKKYIHLEIFKKKKEKESKPPEPKITDLYEKYVNNEINLNHLKEEINLSYNNVCRAWEVLEIYESIKDKTDENSIDLVKFIESLYINKFGVIKKVAMLFAKIFSGYVRIFKKQPKSFIENPESFIMYLAEQGRVSELTIKVIDFEYLLNFFPRLKKIHLIDSNGNYDILTKFIDLKVLKIADGTIRDMDRLKCLKSLKNLRKLKLSCDYLKKVKYLEYLNNLEELILYNCSLKKIEGFEQLTNIKKLTLKWQLLTEISGLDTLENLEYLDLSKNRITEIKGLDNLKKLKCLILKNNEIIEIDESRYSFRILI